jgi:hypothetical protein
LASGGLAAGGREKKEKEEKKAKKKKKRYNQEKSGRKPGPPILLFTRTFFSCLTNFCVAAIDNLKKRKTSTLGVAIMKPLKKLSCRNFVPSKKRRNVRPSTSNKFMEEKRELFNFDFEIAKKPPQIKSKLFFEKWMTKKKKGGHPGCRPDCTKTKLFDKK